MNGDERDATLFDDHDVDLLLDRYYATNSDPRRPPWTWSALTTDERAALTRMIDVWVDSYNQVHAVHPTETIPPCWRDHPGLATELAVQVWLWYQAHHDPRTTPHVAGDYHHRHLPALRNDLTRLLGASPAECRAATTPPPGATTPTPNSHRAQGTTNRDQTLLRRHPRW